MKPRLLGLAAVLMLTMGTNQLRAAGTLTPVGSSQTPIQIRDHHVAIVINNGFARTEVTQTFFNPNATDLEAIYSFPLPRKASLSEVLITIDEKTIAGEVLPREEAKKIYEEEKSDGCECGLATKEAYQRFEFAVHPVRANDETKIRFVYYQPLEIDASVGRFLYPLAEGGTDEKAAQFWLRNERVEGSFSADIEIKSEWPVDDVRIPGAENEMVAQKLGPGHHKIKLERLGGSLAKDLIVYYRLADNLPGRVELVAHRPDANKPGTFMMVVTPGIDLQPIRNGADFVFVLDVSGSMNSKLATLADAVGRTLGQLRPGDRFRIIKFSDSARDLTNGFVPADAANVAAWIEKVKSLRTEGGTDVYEGLELALSKLDADRATSIVLVTDAVTNEGIVDPKEFAKLLEARDVRVFGFVMGNSGNWPLMDIIAKASGGFAAAVSNDDDIVGQILLAKSKIAFESLHDASLSVSGVKVFDATDDRIGKIYRGQQLVIFGRYDRGGKADVALKARLTGQDKIYQTSFEFPEIDQDNPEIERLFALSRVEAIESRMLAGVLPASEAKPMIEKLGVDYQIVTDETSMIVLADDRFEKHGIERRNRDRSALELAAQTRRANGPARSYRIDSSRPMFDHPAPGAGGRKGGGAVDPISASFALLATAGAYLAERRRRVR